MLITVKYVNILHHYWDITCRRTYIFTKLYPGYSCDIRLFML